MPVRLAEAIRLICSSAEDARNLFQLPPKAAKDIMSGKEIKVPKDVVEYVEAVLSHELEYALSARILQLLKDPEKRQLLLQWVHMAVAQVCMFRSMKAIRNESNFVNGFDPFMAPLNSMANAIDEVERFLYQLHENLPQFDEQFFSGTSFLERDEIASTPACAKRVPSRVDVLTLSPKDMLRRTNLKHKQGAQDGNYSEKR